MHSEHLPIIGWNHLTQSLFYNKELNISCNLLNSTLKVKNKQLCGYKMVVSVVAVDPQDCMADWGLGAMVHCHCSATSSKWKQVSCNKTENQMEGPLHQGRVINETIDVLSPSGKYKQQYWDSKEVTGMVGVSYSWTVRLRLKMLILPIWSFNSPSQVHNRIVTPPWNRMSQIFI